MDAGYVITAFSGDIPPSSNPLTPTGAANNVVLPVQATVTQVTAPTGARAAALKKCKKKFRHNAKKWKKCRKKAQLLPV